MSGSRIDLDEVDAIATIHFGLPYGAGRKLTPRQFKKLQEQYKIKLCNIHNMNLAPGQKVITPEDLGHKERKPMTDDQIKATLMTLVGKK